LKLSAWRWAFSY